MVANSRVLIVEDETIVQLHLRTILKELGYVVSGVATTAAEALVSAAADTPDLVLMDIRLGEGRDGIEAARELRSRYDLAVVFLTAYADEETVGRAEEIGRPLLYGTTTKFLQVFGLSSVKDLPKLDPARPDEIPPLKVAPDVV